MTRLQKSLCIALIVCILLLLKSLFWSRHDIGSIINLDQKISKQNQINSNWYQKNLKVYQKIYLLKNDPDYIEGIARAHFGLIQKGELFYQYTVAKPESVQYTVKS